MSGRILDFKQYIGGADNVINVEMFPRDQKSFTYDFGFNVSSYTFSADYQSILLDTVTYDRATGNPNFADTNVIGYFDNYTQVNASFIDETNESAGEVILTIPENRYTGALFPNARTNVVATVLSFQWTAGSEKHTHRYLILERWEPGVTSGDPQVDALFVPFGVGAITAFSSNAGTDVNRVAGTFNNVTGLTSGQGDGAVFQVVVSEVGATTVNLLTRGTKYNTGDTIEILDSSLGNGGGATITITVSSVS